MKLSINRRAGWSLLELLVVMMLLMVLIGVLALLLRESLATEQLQTATYQRVQQSKALADQFRADVAAAEMAPAGLGKFDAGPQTLILQMKNRDHVVYTGRDGVVQRLALAGKDASVRTFPMPGDAKLEFHRTAPAGNLVRLRLVTVRLGKVVPGQSLEFAAALGGDWR